MADGMSMGCPLLGLLDEIDNRLVHDTHGCHRLLVPSATRIRSSSVRSRESARQAHALASSQSSVVLSDHSRSNENETVRSGQHHIGACVTTEKQEANAAVGFGYCEVN
jgi:hypothetical protein